MTMVLVTGASGFVGKFLILELLRKGDTVFALLRQPDTQLPALRQWLQGYGVSAEVCERLLAVRGDLREPGAGIGDADWRAMAAVRVIYHSGALFAWGLTMAEARRVNVDGALELLTAAARQLRLSRFVQVSGYMLTMTAHLRKLGIAGDGAHTDWPAIYRRVGAYEASKLEAHFAIRRTAAALSLPLTVIHPATVIGHGETGEIAANQEFVRTVRDLYQGRLFAVPGSGGYRVPFVSVDVLTGFMARIADYPDTAGQEYLVADAETPSLKGVLTVCARQAGVAAPRVEVPVPLLHQLVRWPWLGRKLGLNAEMLHFLRAEPLDTTAMTHLAGRMGLQPAPLATALARTTAYVLAQSEQERPALAIAPA